MAKSNRKIVNHAIQLLEDPKAPPIQKEISRDILYTLADRFTPLNLLEDVQEAPHDYNYNPADLLEWLARATK